MRSSVATWAVAVAMVASCTEGSRRLAAPAAGGARGPSGVGLAGPWAAKDLMKMPPASLPMPDVAAQWLDFTRGSLRITAPAGADRLAGSMPALSVGVGHDAGGDFLTVWHVDGDRLVRRPRDGASSGPDDLRLGDTTLHGAVLAIGDARALTISGELSTADLVARLDGTPAARTIVARALGYTAATLPARVAIRIEGVPR